MNWDDLRLFLDVVRQPKLEQTALKLNIDATTLSRRLKRLEADLGTTLFERTRRGHMLTPAGEDLAKRVENMESLAFDIASQNDGDLGPSGRIRIGVPEGVGTTIIAPALSEFKHLYSDISVDLIASSGFVSVPKREADMSLLLTRPSAGRMKVRRLSDYSLGLFGTNKYLKGTRPIKTPQDLHPHTLIGYVDDLIYSSTLRYLSDLLPDRTPDLRSTSINAQLEMVKAGAGLAILPLFLARQHPTLLEILPGTFRLSRTFWLAVHEDVAALKRNRLMSDFLGSKLHRLP
ncbi:MAG: LysR family transcriptional regulator [Pseudomonadota bacterium]